MKDKDRDEADQELIKIQKADQQTKDSGKVQPMTENIRQPEQKK